MRQVGRICAGKRGGPRESLTHPEDKTVSDTELLTADQLAERLHIRPRTVKTWARQGRIPTMRLSPKVVRFDWVSVLAALRDRAKPKGVCP
jgi:hypothetical protein